MKNCVFCNIIAGDIPGYLIFQNELVAVLLDINPVSSGHLLVIPKVHIEKVHEIKNTELATAIMMAIISIANKLIEKNFCTDYSITQSNGKYAEQDIEHFHFHIIPRHKNDGVVFKLDTNRVAALPENLAAVAALMTEKEA